MNFSKHRVTESKMLTEMLNYCSSILAYRKKQNAVYSRFSTCVSTVTGGVEIRYKADDSQEHVILAIRYDDLNDYYYFLSKIELDNRSLETRIVIWDRDDFTAYFDHTINQVILKNEEPK